MMMNETNVIEHVVNRFCGGMSEEDITIATTGIKLRMSSSPKIIFYGYLDLGDTKIEIAYPLPPSEENVWIQNVRPTKMILQGEISESTHVQWIQRGMRLLKTSKKHKYNPEIKWGIKE